MDQHIEKANTKLEKVRIIRRGSKLTLRATLPPKPGDGNKPKRYTLSPGFSATAEGLKLTLVEAQRIEADLIYGRFSWDIKKDHLTVEKAISKFEKDYWQRKEKTINRVKNYKYDYSNHFLFLPQDQILTPELLREALETANPDSRKRRGIAIALLCGFFF